MRCTKARELISLDLDGCLPPDRTAGLTRHLDECGDCREFREDLALASRMLAADEPQLPENFEWRLQLRLNQTLAEAAARELHPWQDRRSDRLAWWRSFGAAASVGLAAVLAVAMLVGPRGGDPAATVAELPTTPPVSVTGDRLDLDAYRGFGFGGGGQRTVSTGQPGGSLATRPNFLERGWTYQSVDDLRDWNRIQAENRQLRAQVLQMQRQLRSMQTPLDSASVPALDLPEQK